jgi:DNA-binding IclR family transcriptional regulator
MVVDVQKTRQRPTSARDGNQTLARGLEVLLAIVDANEGLSVQQVCDHLGVHRSIAYRLLQTLSDFGLVARSRGGVYLPGARLGSLADSYQPLLRDVAVPIMRLLADQLGSTVSMFVEEGTEAVAIIMVEPTNAVHHIAFKPGMRTPMDRGAAAYAICAGRPAVPGEPEKVREARERGFARSHGEIEPGAYGVAAGVPVDSGGPRVALNLMTYREEVAAAAGPDLRRAADEVGRAFAEANVGCVPRPRWS